MSSAPRAGSEAKAAQNPRPSAHDRLLDAVVQVACDQGYSKLTVGRVCVRAAVSRATLYQYFSDVDHCFWSAFAIHAERVADAVASAVAGQESREIAMLRALAREMLTRPESARLLMAESLAAGPGGLQQRDLLIAGIERALGASRPSTIALPTPTLIGVAFRFLTLCLEDPTLAEDAEDELLTWAETFARSEPEHPWSTPLAPTPPPSSPRQSIRSGRARGPEPARTRIIQATAAAVYERGYRAMTVAHVAAAAGVSRRQFYNEFPNKRAAFITAYEDGFQRALAACAPAFFASSSWPERVWDSAVAFTAFFARHPAVAYLGFVECYALGHTFSRRVNDTQLAFTLFLEEGFRQREGARGVSRATAALTAVTVAEIAYQAARASPGLYMYRMMPLGVYVALAPFIGSAEADAFVSGKLEGLKRE